MLAIKKWRYPVLVLLLLLTPLGVAPLPLSPSSPSGGKALASARNSLPGQGARTTSFTLDNVSLEVSMTALPSSIFGAASPGSASQVATFTDVRPFNEFSVTAVPYGTKPGTEQVPIARPGGVAAYLDALRSFRVAQGGAPVDGPTAGLFGETARGILSRVPLYLYGSTITEAVVVEWVVEAGHRLWIVRATRELSGSGGENLPTGPRSPFWDSLSQLSFSSDNLDNPSTLAMPGLKYVSPAGTPVPERRSQTSPRDLPFPPWWNNSDCDYDRYMSGSGGIGSFRLGSEYMGIAACGPRPIGDGAPDVLVNFFPGSWGEFDFECVELAMRYLYLAYGINPYEANGNTVVAHYDSSYGGNLVQVSNGTPGIAPRPGDVLSYGGASTFGHAALVSQSNVDSYGNGTVTVVEENNTLSGDSTLSVSGWSVGGNAGSVSGWLTPDDGLPIPTPTPTGQPIPSPTPPGCPGDRFIDVCPGDYFYQAVISLNDRGVISGYVDGTFRPNISTTRGQLAKIVVLAQGWPISTTGGPHFSRCACEQPFLPVC